MAARPLTICASMSIDFSKGDSVGCRIDSGVQALLAALRLIHGRRRKAHETRDHYDLHDGAEEVRRLAAVAQPRGQAHGAGDLLVVELGSRKAHGCKHGDAADGHLDTARAPVGALVGADA
eukprot:CAMPEP_0168356408 /NCGR_PEP_ID=MMETSP0228-20121227/15_1 /TAXON_ID=133427 /ORGANISM="Protoceratium reticulatum, Strain CCCM 535 (=CCMP 1889)" /LENGTH=120 /DNA_ID=CAMNT_0008368813 /DNA_START=286 /DNA_END=643 /DNA_ORIENTATION=-